MEQLSLAPIIQPVMTRKEKAVVSVQMTEGFSPQFADFLEQNWHIYLAFEKRAFRNINRNVRHFGSMAIINNIRWQSALAEKDDQYKINNLRAPDLSRLFAIMNPQHKDFFFQRKRKGEA
jgi:hypothetical protein